MVSNPITCCAVTRWAWTAPGMRRPQHKKAVGAFGPLGHDHYMDITRSFCAFHRFAPPIEGSYLLLTREGIKYRIAYILRTLYQALSSCRANSDRAVLSSGALTRPWIIALGLHRSRWSLSCCLVSERVTVCAMDCTSTLLGFQLPDTCALPSISGF